MREIETPQGTARVHLHPADGAKGAVVLGHGAGGSVDAPDLVAATAAANGAGFTVALVEQPYRVAGRKSSPPPARLDEAWIAAVAELAVDDLADIPLIAGGRSAGARVACRTAEATGALAVLCLAFPLRAPGRANAASRLDELDAVTVPVLIVQGERDPFGMPPAAEHRTVVQVPGDHSLKTDLEAVAAAVRSWLPSVLAQAAQAASSLRH